MATLDQHRESLDPKTTLSEALTGGRGDHVMVGGKPKHVVGYMKDFLFSQEQIRTPLEALSGGERGRLMLARALAKPSNLLVLDEPTNDLDLETLDVLEEMLGDYEGTVILISHDRDFLDRVVTSVIVPEGEGRWIEYAGGYSDMLAQRGVDVKREAVKASVVEEKKEAKAAAPAAAPKRRLNFNEKHALETLPKTIEKLAGRNRQTAEAARRSRSLRQGPQEIRRSFSRHRQGAARTCRGRGPVAGAGSVARRNRTGHDDETIREIDGFRSLYHPTTQEIK